jgi:predicted nucleic acid-binding protein
MVDAWYRTHAVIDASPLIYLAKIDAMEVFEKLSLKGLVTPAVAEETTRPALLYQHEDAALIEQALRDGLLELTQLRPTEQARVDDLAARIPALHEGEREVVAIALVREMPAVLFERRARNVAKTLGVGLVDVIELLFAGTPDDDRLETRIKNLAQLTDMRIADYDALLERVNRRRLP